MCLLIDNAKVVVGLAGSIVVRTKQQTLQLNLSYITSEFTSCLQFAGFFQSMSRPVINPIFLKEQKANVTNHISHQCLACLVTVRHN